MLKASSINRSVDFIRHVVDVQDGDASLLHHGGSVRGDDVSLQGGADDLHRYPVNFYRFSVGLQGRSLMSLKEKVMAKFIHQVMVERLLRLI